MQGRETKYHLQMQGNENSTVFMKFICGQKQVDGFRLEMGCSG